MKLTAENWLRRACALAVVGALCTPSIVGAQTYEFEYQAPVGGVATFNVSGPATEVGGTVEDENGDAFLDSVEMPDGSVFTQYYRPVAVQGFAFTQCQGDAIAVKGGANITEGMPGTHLLGDMVDDGATAEFTNDDVAAFSELVRDTFANQNLNSYIDMGGEDPDFEFILEFDLVLKDNDPEPDDFGELLYFERGRDGGNSWLTIQAVDANGDPLGPELAVGPCETVLTTPPVMVMGSNQQYFGAVAIDISRLGVSETSYLKVRKTLTTDSGYFDAGQSQEDFNPDFKFMAVITHPDQLSEADPLFD